MTTLHRQPGSAVHPASPPPELRVRWTVSARAGHPALRVPDADEITLELAVVPLPDAPGDRHRVTLRALPVGRPPVELRSALLDLRWSADPDLTLRHADAPGVLALTLHDHGDGPPDLWFAHLAWLAELGLPGGRYEVDSALEL